MTRDEAVLRLASHELKALPKDVRQQIIECYFLTDYEPNDPDLQGFPQALQAQLCNGAMPENFESSEYDALVLDELQLGYEGVVNEFIQQKLSEIGSPDVRVTGEPETMETCACCGFNTLTERGAYDICPVCFWEDDGNMEADAYSGPNHMTLREGRDNFLKFGACDESAVDHIDLDGPKKFVKAKSF